MTETPTNILEGIDERSTKGTMLQRLRDAAKQIARLEDEETKQQRQADDARLYKLQAIEDRVRAKGPSQQYNLMQVIVSASEQEFIEGIDFLENWEGFLPPMLVRLHDGAKVLTGAISTTEPAPTEEVLKS